MNRPPAESFRDLLVWQKAQLFVLSVYNCLILAKDLIYGNCQHEMWHLEEVSRLLESYASGTLARASSKDS